MLIAWAGLCSGCLDKSGSDPDAGPSPDVEIAPDSALQDATPGADAAVSCALEDLTEQLTCGSGRKCTLVDAPGNVGCAASGFTAAYSACDGSSRPDTCAIGTLCSDEKEAGNFVCLPFCGGEGSSCEGGRCAYPLSLPGGQVAYLCEPEDGCDPVNALPGVGCPTGQACYLTREGGGLAFCELEGAEALGATCDGEFSCQAGLTCFGPPGETGTCVKVCHRDNDAECSPQLCGPVTENYGICQ